VLRSPAKRSRRGFATFSSSAIPPSFARTPIPSAANVGVEVVPQDVEALLADRAVDPRRGADPSDRHDREVPLLRVVRVRDDRLQRPEDAPLELRILRRRADLSERDRRRPRRVDRGLRAHRLHG
jgi:hypothetical protein